MLHVGFRAMHESMTSQKIKKLGAFDTSMAVFLGVKRASTCSMSLPTPGHKTLTLVGKLGCRRATSIGSHR